MKRNALHYLGNLGPLFSGLLTAPLSARALGVEGRAEIVIITTLSALFIVIGSLGFGWVVRDAVASNRHSLLFWRSVGARLAGVAVPLGAVLGLGLGLALDLSWWECIATSGLFALSGIATRRGIDANALVSLGLSDRVGLSNALYAAGTLITIVALYVAGLLTVMTALVANVLGLLVQTLVLTLSMRGPSEVDMAEQSRVRAEMERTTGGFASLFRKSANSWATQMLDATATRWDFMVVASAQTKNGLGLYSVVALIPQIFYRLFASVTQATFSRFPDMQSKHRLVLIVHVNLTLAVVGAVVAGGIAYPLIPIVFGEDFREAREFLVPAGLMTIGLALFAAIAQDVARERRLGAGALIAVVSLAPACASAGLLGAFWAVCLSAALTAISSAGYAFNRVGSLMFTVDGRSMRELFR